MEYYDDYNNSQPEQISPRHTAIANFEENVIAQSYIFMFAALLITAFTAYYVISSPVIFYRIFYSSYGLVGLCLGEFIVVMAANRALSRNAVIPGAVLFTLYSVFTGALLSSVFVVYDIGSIYTTFLVCSFMFAVMSVYGLVTKRDLTSVGNLCMTFLIGIIIAGIVNMFIGSSMLDMLISFVGIVIFVGIIAYDTQKIKSMIYYTDSENITSIALMGALELYLDFINLFLRLLRFFGKRRD